MCALVTATPGNPFGRRHVRTESNWNLIGHDGDAWLSSHGYQGYDKEIARGVGYCLMIWLDQNAEPGRVKRVTQALNGQVESVTIHEDYAARCKRWRQARDTWLTDYIVKEYGLSPKPKVEATPVDKDADAEAYTNKLLDRVHGKELPEYQLGPAPPGRHWSLVEDEPVKKPRGGKRFSTIYQPRWGKK